ncbi:magnesium transporter NIPA-domain-containing protein [Leucosporidium creatinivorum]|uniref:Magnesium transporter NIPA-domain-containing protein n=1 Tax=Leucosporidium creatinivorum TaxID=106004 RepID=A0A1Y2FTV8_9BASI|nr:magnesium transporter NIPA-domain-containing protein [Leucosporidium creatinivorum]
MSTTSALASATSAAISASASAASKEGNPASYKVVGVCLAIGSGLFIGSSFVIKKKGLLSAQAKAGGVAGEGHAYLKSPLWWTGMILMIIGEILNFVAYAFTEAILVTPLGALSVVICAVLSSIFLKEKLTFFGKVGCLLAILGATIVALNGPQEQSTTTIKEFQHLFLSPGFLVYGSLVIAVSLGLIFFVAPKYGKTHMLVYITICSLIGGLSVACTSGLGSSILTSIRGDNQVKHWFFWFLFGFVVITLLTEINYLNKALELYNTAMVTPTYYVIFTGATLVTSVILNQGFAASAVDIVTVVMGFLVICCGITLLQLSKVEPSDIASTQGLDRRSTMLLSASRARAHVDADYEKGLDMEDPGIDALRGSFGAIGSIHRAMSARRSMRRESRFDPSTLGRTGAPGAMGSGPTEGGMGMSVLRGVQLYDAPMPYDAADKISFHSATISVAPPEAPFASGSGNRDRTGSITFAQSDSVHIYPTDPHGAATHHDQDRLAGSHMHIPQPGSADIANSGFSPSSAFSVGAFSSTPSSPALTRSATSPTTPAYTDPFEEGKIRELGDDEDDDEKDATRAQTLPRRGSSPLAERLGQRFAASSPDVTSPTSSSRSRFGLPSFSSRDSSKDRHRTAHPHGPKDIEESESEALVGGEQAPGRRDSLDSEEGLSRFETRDSTDQL